MQFYGFFLSVFTSMIYFLLYYLLKNVVILVALGCSEILEEVQGCVEHEEISLFGNDTATVLNITAG